MSRVQLCAPAILCGLSIFSPCLCRFSQSTPVSSHMPKTCMARKKISCHLSNTSKNIYFGRIKPSLNFLPFNTQSSLYHSLQIPHLLSSHFTSPYWCLLCAGHWTGLRQPSWWLVILPFESSLLARFLVWPPHSRPRCLLIKHPDGFSLSWELLAEWNNIRVAPFCCHRFPIPPRWFPDNRLTLYCCVLRVLLTEWNSDIISCHTAVLQ